MPRKELEAVLDYILNKADGRELEVIVKACERRRRDTTLFASLGGEGPSAMARRMAGELEKGTGATMESVRATVRSFVADIIRKNAPEIGEEELERLLDEYAPPPGARDRSRPGPGAGGGVAEGAGLPPAALLAMVRSFVEYAEGDMAPSRQRELWERNTRWQDEYWAAFPAEVKALVKAYLDGRIDATTFTTGLLSVLGV